MKKLKVSEATGAVLDWLVAKCEGFEVAFTTNKEVVILREGVTDYFDPHRNWGWGGPIIEREKIDLFTEKQTYAESWCASMARYQNGMRLVGWRMHQYGATPLIAAMRCNCCSKLGDEVEVPEELL